MSSMILHFSNGTCQFSRYAAASFNSSLAVSRRSKMNLARKTGTGRWHLWMSLTESRPYSQIP
jgi:hypothetical protein